jgi:glycosyltransferase involved in cell wall biosynthesis
MAGSKQMSKHKVVRFLIIASYPDSIITFRGKLIEALIEQEIEVHVAAPDLPQASAIRRTLESMGVSVHNIHLQRTGMNPFIDVLSLVCMFVLMKKHRYTFVLSYTVKPVIYGLIAGWIARIPHRFALITGLGYAFTGGKVGKRGFLQKMLHKMYSFALARVELTFFQNPDDEKLFCLEKILQHHAKTIVLRGSGVDLEEYHRAPLLEEPHFLFIGRLLGDKGVREYAQAAKHIRTKYPNATFSIVGWIDNNPDAITQLELDEWISGGYIDFLGRVDDVRPAICKSNVYVLPSYREGTPRTVLEAMSMGRPIITTDVPGCRETVNDGVNGFLIQAKSVDSLIYAMEQLIINPELIKIMGTRSREIAEQKFDVHKVNEVMLKEMNIT